MIVKKIAYVSNLDGNLYGFRLAWMKALQAKGFEVCAIAPEGEYGKLLRAAGIKTLSYPMKRGGLNPFVEAGTVVRLFRIFRREKFHLVHSFTAKPNVYCSIAGAFCSVPVVNHVTGLGYFFTESGAKARLLRAMIEGFYKISFRCAKRVVFQNPEDMKELETLVEDSKKVLIPGTGVDSDFFSPSAVDLSTSAQVRGSLQLAANSTVVTVIGRLLWHKGIREFVEAAKILMEKRPNVEFLVVGWHDTGNPSAVTLEFLEEAKRLPRLHFAGKRDNIREILAVTDIYVLPSYREGMPRTVLEAMAMCKPVVTTDVPGCRQAVVDGVTGLVVPPRDSAGLAQAIEKLLQSQELCHAMGQAGRNRAVAQFSNQVVIKELLRMYSELKLC